jgi:hypothetical protein
MASSPPLHINYLACTLLALVVWSACLAQATLPVPCSIGATKEAVEACVLTLTMNYLAYEEAGDWEAMFNVSTPDAHQVYGATLLGGYADLPRTSDQSLYYMNTRINWANNTPSDFTYLSVSATVGSSSISFQYIAQFTHTSNFWLAPYPATNRSVSLVMVLFIQYDENNLLISEYVHYDQASLLVQIGVLPSGYGVYHNNITAPYPEDTACQHPLPVVGSEFADLLIAGPSPNSTITLNGFYVNEAPAPTSPCAKRSHPAPRRSGYATRSALVAARLAQVPA